MKKDPLAVYAALVVYYTGEVEIDVDLSYLRMHSANLVIVTRNGRLIVYKERYALEEHGAEVTHERMFDLAKEHVKAAKAARALYEASDAEEKS